MTKEDILLHLPYAPPFLFVDALEYIDDAQVVGTYTFKADLPCYQGHFKGHPVTPGVLLTEVMAQIGLACLGIYLLRRDTATGARRSHDFHTDRLLSARLSRRIGKSNGRKNIFPV